jgi:hypothetical protein
MSSILAAIATWISGAVIPAIEFLIEGVTIAVSFIGTPIGAVLLCVFAIALITVAVISYYQNLFDSVEKNYENAQIVDKEGIFKQLNDHKGEAATIETNLTFFENKINDEVNKLLTQEKVSKDKASLINIFINSILSSIKNAKKGGENIFRKSYQLHEKGLALLYFNYKKKECKITLSFTFYDDKILEYLKYLVKMIKKLGYNLEKNYENDLQNIKINEEDDNVYKIIIKNI